MTDPRWRRLASVIARGTKIGSGDRVSISLTDVNAFQAVESLVEEVYRRGAKPEVLLVDERFDRAALRFGDVEQVARVPNLEAHAMRSSDIHIAVRGLVPPDRTSMDLPAERIAAQRAAKGRISTLRWQKTRWCIVRVPGLEWADHVGLDPDLLLEEFFAGCLMDWVEERRRWHVLQKRLEGAKFIEVRTSDTYLSLDVTGRRWVVFAGEANLPDGEIATAPLETGVDGHITFDDPCIFAGRHISGLRLAFDKGRLVSLQADEGESFLKALVATDAGASRVGELGIGLNPQMGTLTQDLFFDEKILGTVHVALGRAYPACGGINDSAIHWDVVKDLRPRFGRAGGDLMVDGESLIAAGHPLWDSDR